MISLRALTKRFGNVTAVDALHLAIAKGEIFGLVGPDGAGKTTTLRMLAGLVDATEGTAEVAGFDVATQTIEVRDRIGYMAQRFGLYSDLTVGENMRFYADLFGMPRQDRETLSPKLLAMTRMAEFVNRPAGKLSGGMKQKLALMCTLLHKPQVLLLDEPTNGVDPVSRRDFWVILHQLVRDGLTLLLTTAYMDEAERCDRVGLMHQGRLLRCDSPAGLRQSVTSDCYSVETQTGMRAERERLSRIPSVTAVRPAGSTLHVFLKPGTDAAEIWPPDLAKVERIAPSLEDVFVATVEAQGAASW
jgi:ABC-2 type transport system ATP-binding protein